MIKIMNRWTTEGIEVKDEGLKNYITLEPKIVLRSAGRYAGQKFYKSRINIVERLINKLMVPGHRGKKHFKSSGHNCGKVTVATKIVMKAFQLIEEKLKKNPIEVFVKAVENAAPREETVSIEYGGARYPKAVECGAQRRIDLALRYMVQGAYHKRFATKKKSHEALAEEIINAYNNSNASNAISKKLELERQADASR